MTSWANKNSAWLKLVFGDAFRSCSLLGVFNGGLNQESLILSEVEYHFETNHAEGGRPSVLENGAKSVE